MGTVNFSLGENFGIMMVKIAQEKFLYKHDGEGAIKFLTDSFPGMSEVYALQILKGDLVIIPEEDGNVNVRHREDEDKDYPIIDFDKHFEMIAKMFINESYNDDDSFLYLSRWFRDNIIIRWNKEIPYYIPNTDIFGEADIYKAFSYNELYNIIKENDEEKINILNDYALVCEKLDRDIKYIKMVLQWVNDCENINKFCKFVKDKYNHQFDKEELSTYISSYNELMKMIEFMNRNSIYKIEDFEDSRVKELDKFIESEINYQMNQHSIIEPSDINIKYDAAWVSPDGEIFGMNGSIGNMLHNKLADRINERVIKLTGKSLVEEGNQNIDYELSKLGWAKLHENRVLYDGYDMEPYVHMTEKQQNVIYKYMQIHHRGIIQCGYKEPISTARFSMTDKYQLDKLFSIK